MKEYGIMFFVPEGRDEFWEEVNDIESPIERAKKVEEMIRDCLAQYGIDEYHQSLQMTVVELIDGQQLSLL